MTGIYFFNSILHFSPDFELNHCNDFFFSSHAIATYMATRYWSPNAGKLLPSDPGSRALIDQFMFFNSNVLYPRYKEAAVSENKEIYC